MSIESELIISILKLSKTETILQKQINKDAKIGYGLCQKLLRKLQNEGLVYVKEGILETTNVQRLKLGVYAIQLGADVERVSSFLQWKEFEAMTAVVLEQNDFSVHTNVHFSHVGRRWEIDVVGCKKPICLCIDCKHWHHGMHRSALVKIADEQIERTSALADSLPNLAEKIECVSWNEVNVVPAILSLMPGSFKFHNKVPIVPVLQLQEFLSQLPAYANSLKHFLRLINHL